MNILMKSMMISCQKSSELIDKQTAFRLSWIEKQKLKVHTKMCDVCNTYLKQSRWLDEILHNHSQCVNEKNIEIIVNEELKERIISKL